MRNAKRYGMQIADDGDLIVRDGGVSMGDTLAQNEYILLLSHQGELKENPLLGAGVADMVGSHDVSDCKRKVIDALKGDGMTVQAVEMKEGSITRLEAKY